MCIINLPPAEIMYENLSQVFTGHIQNAMYKQLCVSGCPLVIRSLKMDANTRAEQGLGLLLDVYLNAFIFSFICLLLLCYILLHFIANKKNLQYLLIQ